MQGEALDAVFRLIDATTEGEVVESCCELECVASIVQRENRLHGTLTERGLTDDQGSVPVLQCTGNNFSGTGGTLVHEDDHWNFRLHERCSAGCTFGLLCATTSANDDVTRLEEQFADFDSLIQKSTRIVAHVEDELLHALLLEAAEGVFDIACRLVAKGGKLDVADFRSDHAVIRNGVNNDFCSGDGVVHEVGNAFAFNGDRHVCANFAAEFVDRVIERHAFCFFAVNFADAVASADAELECRCAGKRRNNCEDVVAEADGNTHATELTFHRDAEAFVILGGENRRVRVENVSDAIDGGVREFRRVNVFNVFAVDFGKDLVQS